MNVREVATELGMSKQWVQRALLEGRIPARKNEFGFWSVKKKDLPKLRREIKHPRTSATPAPAPFEHRPEKPSDILKRTITPRLITELAHVCPRCSIAYSDPDKIETCAQLWEKCWLKCPVCHPSLYQ